MSTTPEEEVMHTFRAAGATQPHLFDVGYYDNAGVWKTLGTYPSAEIAAQHVNYLNGGTGAKFPA